MLFFDPLYLLLMLPFGLLAMWASSRVKGTYAKYSKVPIRSGFSGADTPVPVADSSFHVNAISADIAILPLGY